MDEKKIEFLDWAVAELDRDAEALEQALGSLYSRRRDVLEAKRKLLAKAIIEKTGLRKSMVAQSFGSDSWFGTVWKFVEWIDGSLPKTEWFEWNGNVYSRKEFAASGTLYDTPLLYSELED